MPQPPQPPHSARFALLALLLLSSCSRAPEANERHYTIPASPSHINLTLPGDVVIPQAETLHTPTQNLRLARMVDEGSEVAPGDIVAHIDTQLLESWLNYQREDLAVLQRRIRAANLANERALYNRRTQILQREADFKTKQLEWQQAAATDAARYGVLERERDLAQQQLNQAAQRLEALRTLQEQGGISTAEMRTALATMQQARAQLRIPTARLADFLAADKGHRDQQRLQQELDRLGLELADASLPGSLRHQLASFLLQQHHDLNWVDLEQQRITNNTAQAQAVLDNPVLRSEHGGVVHQPLGGTDLPPVSGAELVSGELARISPSERAVIHIHVPEIWREAVRHYHRQNPAPPIRLDYPHGHQGRGTLTQLSSARDTTAYDQPASRGVITPATPPPPGSLGSRIHCQLPIAVPPGAVVIPSWYATGQVQRSVHMADGSQRPITARPIGDQLLVTQGLQPGDTLLPPNNEPHPRTLLHATVAFADFEKITIGRLSPWRWEIEWLAPEGATVAANEVVARLHRIRGEVIDEHLPDIEHLKAEAARDLARIKANGELGEAWIAWQQARLDTEAARLAWTYERQRHQHAQQIATEVNAELAALELEQNRHQTEQYTDPAYDEIRSRDQRAQDRLRLQTARLDLRLARIEAAAERHAPDPVQRQHLRFEWQRAQALEQTEAQAWKRAQTTHRRALASAETTWTKAVQRLQRQRRRTSRIDISTPVAGRVYRNTHSWYPIEVGHQLSTAHLFSIPTSTRRRFVLHLPARLYRSFEEGQSIEFLLPATGHQPHRGTIVQIADFFEKRQPSTAASDTAANRPLQTTVRMTVEFQAANLHASPPGSQVVYRLP